MFSLELTENQPVLLHPDDMTALIGCACPAGMSPKEMKKYVTHILEALVNKKDIATKQRPDSGRVLQYLFKDNAVLALDNVTLLNEKGRVRNFDAFEPTALIQHVESYGAREYDTQPVMFAKEALAVVGNFVRGKKTQKAYNIACTDSPHNFNRIEPKKNMPSAFITMATAGTPKIWQQ